MVDNDVLSISVASKAVKQVNGWPLIPIAPSHRGSHAIPFGAFGITIPLHLNYLSSASSPPPQHSRQTPIMMDSNALPSVRCVAMFNI